MPSYHTSKSPSQAERYTECPGSGALIGALPPEQRDQSGQAAQLGTAAHGLLEACLKQGKEPADFRGRIIEVINDEGTSILREGARAPKGTDRVWFVVDDEMVDGVDTAIGYIARRLDELGVGRDALQMESRTNPLPDRDDTSGTADVTINAFPELLEVVDYKNGFIVVEHRDNPQLLGYLLGKAIDNDWAFDRYAVTVVQPNADHPEGTIRTFYIDEAGLRAFAVEHRKNVERAVEAEDEFPSMDPDLFLRTYLKAGRHCTFCEAAPTCPARKRSAQQAAAIDFAEEPRELDFSAQDEAASEIAKWGPDLDRLVRQANEYLQRALESGRKVPGWKLVRKRSVRKWQPQLDEAEIASALEKDYGLSPEDLFTEPELLSGPQVEKLIPRKRRKQFNDDLLVKPEGGLTLAREDDEREGVEVDPGADFTEADDDDAGIGF